MPEWSTYTLGDFLMFSPRVYWRLVESYNGEWWPGQLLAIAAGIAALVVARSPDPRSRRILALLLAAAWCWTGWAFLWDRFADVNFAAPWLAAACGVQAALLAVRARQLPEASQLEPARMTAWCVAVFAVLAYPLVGLVFGRPIAQEEVFGFMPDPTALATLGFVFSGALGERRWLVPVPAVMLAIGWLTLFAMR